MGYVDDCIKKKEAADTASHVRVEPPKKDTELTLDNAEITLQCLKSGASSESVDVVEVACKALLKYIKAEEIYQRKVRVYGRKAAGKR